MNSDRKYHIKGFKTGLGQTLRYDSLIGTRSRRIYTAPGESPTQELTSKNIASMPLTGRKPEATTTPPEVHAALTEIAHSNSTLVLLEREIRFFRDWLLHRGIEYDPAGWWSPAGMKLQTGADGLPLQADREAGADSWDAYLARHHSDRPGVREAVLGLAELERLRQPRSADETLAAMLRVSGYDRILMLADLEPWAHAYTAKTAGLNNGNRNHTPEDHRRVEQRINQLIADCGNRTAAIKQASEELGIPIGTIKRWSKDKLINIKKIR